MTVLHDVEAPGGGWRGLAFRSARARPGLHVALAGRLRWALVLDGHALLLSRLDDWWEHHARLLGTERREVLPPISAGTSRQTEGLRGWARHFAQTLHEAPGSPLHGGEYRLWPAGPEVLPLEWEAALEEVGVREHEPVGDGRVLPLRLPSPSDAPRVKALRKLARDGVLPPVLLWHLPGLHVCVLVDGHDRLLACRLESVAPRFLVLQRQRVSQTPPADAQTLAVVESGLWASAERADRRRPFDVAGANRLLLRLHGGEVHLQPVERAWPMPGGGEAFERVWAERARAFGVDPRVL